MVDEHTQFLQPAPFCRVGEAFNVRLRGKKVLFKGRREGGMCWYHYRETREGGGRDQTVMIGEHMNGEV